MKLYKLIPILFISLFSIIPLSAQSGNSSPLLTEAVVITSSRTAQESDLGKLIYFDTSGGAITYTIPEGMDSNGEFSALIVDNSNAVTIVGGGGVTMVGDSGVLTSLGTYFYIRNSLVADTWNIAGNKAITVDIGNVTGTGSDTNAQTGTTYTVVLTDGDHDGKRTLVTMDNANANTATIPPNSTTAFEVGDQIDFMQIGAGTTTVQGGTGVMVNGVVAGSRGTASQYDAITAIKLATDTWVLVGGIQSQTTGPELGWTTPANIATDGDTIVLTEGSLIRSESCRNVADITVNSVVFSQTSGALDGFLTQHIDGNIYQGGNVGTDFETMLDGFNWGTGSPLSIDFTGLIIGQTYMLQIFQSDDRSGSGGKIQTWEIAGHTSASMLLTTSRETHCYFIATANTETLTVTVTGSGSSNASINGLQLRQI